MVEFELDYRAPAVAADAQPMRSFVSTEVLDLTLFSGLVVTTNEKDGRATSRKTILCRASLLVAIYHCVGMLRMLGKRLGHDLVVQSDCLRVIEPEAEAEAEADFLAAGRCCCC